MPDTPAKPTVEAMKAARNILRRFRSTLNRLGCNPAEQLSVAADIDADLDLPALLACAKECDLLKRQLLAAQTTIEEMHQDAAGIDI